VSGQKIVFFDTWAGDKPYYTRRLKNVFNVRMEYTDEPLTEVTASRHQDMTIASVSVTSDVSARALAKLPELEYIASRSTGVNHIDTEAADGSDVLVSTVPARIEATVAEHTIMLLLALARQLGETTQHVRQRVVDHTQATGFEVAGKTIGIVGCGRVGGYVARVAAALGMDVIGCDPKQPPNEYITYASFDHVLENSDILSLHAPGNQETRHMINADRLAQMKQGAVLLNTAAGDLIDTGALIEALFSGSIGAAGLDVLEGEQLLRLDEEIALLHPDVSRQDLLINTEHDTLLRMPNVIITPHNGFNSQEAIGRIRQETAENIKQYLQHQPRNVVNKK
jgi:D-lactate dehydrogenase